jgi:hypothetical protein
MTRRLDDPMPRVERKHAGEVGMSLALALLVALIPTAVAGSGPWVVGDRGYTLYLGVEAQRFDHLGIVSGTRRDVLEVGEGVTSFGLKGIGTVGVGSRAELEIGVPWYRVQANRQDAELCDLLGLGACDRTQGIGVVQARLKGLLLDEFFGAPISLAVGGELRLGQVTAETRQRVTNLGEGTVDFGPYLDLGRTGSLGGGYWSSWIEAGFRYRVPMTDQYPNLRGDTVVPGSEITGAAELILGPSTSFALGPRLDALWRPAGLDFDELDLGDPDRFGALAIGSLRAGAVGVVRTRGVAASISVARTLYAVNNPTDTYVVSLGVQLDGRFAGSGDG